MIELLKESGKVPECKDRFTILVMTGMSKGRHFLSSEVGIGSRLHCLSGS